MDFVQETHMMLNRRYSKCPSHNGISLGGLWDKKYKFCLASTEQQNTPVVWNHAGQAADQSAVQTSKSRSAEQLLMKTWHPCYAFFILLFGLVWTCLIGKSLVLLGALWMHCWKISSSCFIQFVYLGTAMWSKHEAAGCTFRFNSNLSPSQLKQELRWALQWERRTEKVPLNTCCSWGVLLCTTRSHFGVRAAALVTCIAWAMWGKYKVLLFDAIRTRLKVNQILLLHGWNTGALLCRIVP